MTPSPQVILNADDFGRSHGINAAVRQACEQGALTSASLMVAGDAADEAVAIARDHPGLAVGLHVVIVAGRATSPPEQIPHLVDRNGLFPNDPFSAGVRCFFNGAARRELAAEIDAQFERFAASGLPMAHVDGHAHMHLHPVAFDAIVPLAIKFGARRVRIPRDDLRLDMSLNSRHPAQKALWAAVFGVMCRSALRRLRGTPLQVTDRVYGLFESGHMSESYVTGVLRNLKTGSAELYFHPAVAPPYDAEGPNPGDLSTLLSKAVQQAIVAHGLRPTGVLT